MARKVKQELKEEGKNGSGVKENGENNGSNRGSGENKNDKPKAFTIKYKRPRGSRACVVCRSRKVRCDAEIHIPCTNCITFGCECQLPEVKKRGSGGGESKAKRSKSGDSDSVATGSAIAGAGKSNEHGGWGTHGNSVKPGPDGPSMSSNEPVLNISQVSVPPSLTSNYKTRPGIHKRELSLSKAQSALTFLGNSSVAMVALTAGQTHVQLPEDLFDEEETSLDSVELEILKLRGAFLLPSNELALDLINSYFTHVHPLMPVINRSEFMRKFNDPNDNPSLMLLQAVLLCGSRVSLNPLLFDSKGSKDITSLTFFRRAKALYETNYESDPLSIIQTLLLIGSYGEGPEDVTKNTFYWTRVAIGLAQGFGLHRDVTNSPGLTNTEKKIWRRVWWTLFEKDRNVAIAFGRPTSIDLNDCDVPMLTIDDFNEDEPGYPSPYPLNELQALYYIHLVKLAEITGIIIKNQYTVKAEKSKNRNNFSIIHHCDMLMGIWFSNLPPQLSFSLTDPSTQNFYSCLLNSQYYSRLYLIHRYNLVRMARSSSTDPNNYRYPSWGISFQAARMISIVSKILLDHDQIKYCPLMYVYIIFSALLMLIYHVDSPNTAIASTASDSLYVSRAVLKELVKYWPIANVLLRLFDKHANDKMKRAKVIENCSKAAELQDLDNDNNQKPDQAMGDLYNNSVDLSLGDKLQLRNNLDVKYSMPAQDPRVSPSSLISPGLSSHGGNYNHGTPANFLGTPQAYVSQHSEPLEHNFEKLVEQYKLPKAESMHTAKGGNTYNDKADTIHSNSPSEKQSTSSSTGQFISDISLVTENVPIPQNFYENFEPTQLFPSVAALESQEKLDYPNQQSTNVFGKDDMASAATSPQRNVVENGGASTPGGTNLNFVDSSYINMNLHSTADSNFLNNDLGGLFHFPP